MQKFKCSYFLFQVAIRRGIDIIVFSFVITVYGLTQSFEQMKDVADRGVAPAYADMARKYANGSGKEKDIEKAQEYFLKTIEAGLLDKSDAVEYLSLLNENPDVVISDELRVHLMRTVSISLPYWLNIQKRINNL